MAKIIITLFCAFIACAAAKPQFIASFAAAPFAAAPAPVVPAAYAAAPLAYTNLPLDAAYASSSIDVRQNYASAVLPAASYAVPAVYSAPVAPVPAPVAPVAPLKYTAAAPVLV